jgi:predicted aconitase with swiveling domain
LSANVLVPGIARGAPLMLAEPLSFWGGLDAATGAVIDRWHPDCGTVLTGRIVLMREGRGSSSGSSVLAEAIRLRTAPAAILMRERNAIVVTGALVARELYGTDCPVIEITDEELWAQACGARTVEIAPDGTLSFDAQATGRST